jgi:hypothetical protein
MSDCTRRELLAGAAAGVLAGARPLAALAQTGLGFPLEDYHVHLNAMTIDQVVETSRQTGVKYGILEHCGTKENQYPIVLSTDKDLLDWIAKLQGKDVYVCRQWTAPSVLLRNCFSQLDHADGLLTVATPTGSIRPSRVRPRHARR